MEGRWQLGGPKPLLLDLVQMICLSCLNVRVFKNRRRKWCSSRQSARVTVQP